MRFTASLLLVTTSLLDCNVQADNWAPITGDSTLTFTAEQEGALFDGEFREFRALFILDPADPTTAHIEATIAMHSVDTAYDERDEYLRGEEWFHAERWPSARFTTANIRITDAGYLADGALTIRDQTREVALAFTLDPLANGRLLFRGETLISRLDFGVGQGQWADTEWVGDEITIRVNLVLERVLP